MYNHSRQILKDKFWLDISYWSEYNTYIESTNRQMKGYKMFKRVDVDNDVIEGFSYFNRTNNEERVEINRSGAYIKLKEGEDQDMSIVYFQDIPKLIKALQAAYDHITET